MIERCLEIKDLKMLMSTLRCFGSSISNIKCRFGSLKRFNDVYFPIIRQIKQFCADSLKKFVLRCNRWNIFTIEVLMTILSHLRETQFIFLMLKRSNLIYPNYQMMRRTYYFPESHFHSTISKNLLFWKPHRTEHVVNHLYKEIKSYERILKTGFLSKSKLKKALPSLREICLKRYPNRLSIHEVICYLIDFESMKCFSFYCLNSESEIGEACLSSQWQIADIKSPTYYVTLERKMLTNF